VFHHQSAPDVTDLPAGAYLVRRKLSSIEGYLVYDATDAQVYHFKGHLAFPGARWSMLDASGSEVAALARPAMHLHPTFTVTRPGRSEVTIRKASFAPIMETWRLEGSEDGDIDMHGDVLNHEFTFERDGRAVGTTTRRWISLTDAYAVQANGMDPVLAIAAAVGVDSVESERNH
jgi:uncharacterized protein YxjI